jgi:hypothetical protein
MEICLELTALDKEEQYLKTITLVSGQSVRHEMQNGSFFVPPRNFTTI